MREIKFRGQMTTGEWVYGYLTKDIGGSTAYYKECSYRISWYPDTGGQANAPVKNDTIGQFTGLHDRDGREIYEGDIVTLQSWKPSTMQIRFIEGAFCLADSDEYCVADIHYVQHAGRPIAIIIGNIHDNPELLTIGGKE